MILLPRLLHTSASAYRLFPFEMKTSLNNYSRLTHATFWVSENDPLLKCRTGSGIDAEHYRISLSEPTMTYS